MDKNLKLIHGLSSYHRDFITSLNILSCFYCKGYVRPAQIEEWTDGGDTALCPLCGVDAVVPDLSADLLEIMHEAYFD